MPRPRAIEDSELLPKLMQVFWRNGYDNTGVRELESALGLKAPSLYHRFGSKEALFEAALTHYVDSVVRWRVVQYLEADDPLKGLRKFFDTTYDYITKRQPGLGCLLVNTSLESNANAPPIAEQLARGSQLIRSALRAALQRAKRSGALGEDVDVDALADCLHLGLQGLLVTSKLESDPAVLKRRTDSLFATLGLTVTRKQRHS